MVLLMKCTCIALLSTDHFDPAKCCLQQTDCMSLLFLFSLTCLWQSAQSLYTGRAFHIGIRKVRHARRLGQVHCLQPSLLDDTVAVDVSPEHNGSILKKLLRSGDESQRKPLMRDTVAIEWKIYRTDGSLVHDSSRPADASTCTQSSEVESNNKPSMMQNGTFEIEEEHFQFKLGATPRQVITGWEYAVKTMNPGELSLFTIAPEHAFGTMGAPPLIAPDSTLLCELELVNIIPSLTSKYKTVGYNESIRDELMEQIQSGQSPVAPAVTHTRSKKDQVTQAVRTSNVASAAVESTVTPSSDEGSVDRSDSRTGAINDNRGQTVGGEAPRAREEGMEAKFFDPDTHKLDSKLQVSGIGKGYMWTENRHTLDIEVPIRLADPGTIHKRDLLIDICVKRISVKLTNGTVLLEGPLHGGVDPSECNWSLLEYSPAQAYKTQASHYVQLFLQKGYQHRDVWATVLDRQYLKEKESLRPVHSEEYACYEDYLQHQEEQRLLQQQLQQHSGEEIMDVSYVDVMVNKTRAS